MNIAIPVPDPDRTAPQRLSNGVWITLDPRPHAHSAAVVLWVAGGTREEGDTDAGHLHLLEHLLLHRTLRSDAPVLARRIAELGGMVNAETGREHLALIGRAPAGQARALAELLVECLCEPAFDDGDLALEQGVIEAERTFVGQTPPQEALIRLAWPQHPLGRLLLPADPAPADASALRRLWAHQCVGARLRVAVVGNFEPAALLGPLAPLDTLPAGTAPDWGTPPRFMPGRYGELREDRPATLLWALPCTPYAGVDSAGWELAATILEHTLTATLRDSGLAYACAVWPQLHSDSGLVVVQVSAAPGRVSACANAVNASLDALVRDGPSPTTRTIARSALDARAVLARDDLEGQARTLAQDPASASAAVLDGRLDLSAFGSSLQVVL